jgi:hypothetical protein
VKANEEYHFMYRGVNYIGEGPNSTVTVIENVAPPNGQLQAPSVALDLSIPGTPMV